MLGYVGAAATKSIILGLIILATAGLFVPLRIAHPFWMLAFLVLTAVTFSLFGFIIGIWADGFEKLQIVPLLIITPLTFLGGTFYSIDVLPPFWQTVTLFNPVVYLVSGFRWSFYEIADVSVGMSLAMTLLFLLAAWRRCGGCSGPVIGSRNDADERGRNAALKRGSCLARSRPYIMSPILRRGPPARHRRQARRSCPWLRSWGRNCPGDDRGNGQLHF